MGRRHIGGFFGVTSLIYQLPFPAGKLLRYALRQGGRESLSAILEASDELQLTECVSITACYAKSAARDEKVKVMLTKRGPFPRDAREEEDKGER